MRSWKIGGTRWRRRRTTHEQDVRDFHRTRVEVARRAALARVQASIAEFDRDEAWAHPTSQASSPYQT